MKVLRIKKNTISPVGETKANSSGLAFFMSARLPTGLSYSNLFNNAKRMKENPTYYEKLLFDKLTKEKIEFKFQKIFPPYIVDFIFPSKLIVEIDGEFHNRNINNQTYDCDRDCYLMSFGFVVWRFTNKEIENNLDCIINKIKTFSSPSLIKKPFKKLKYLIGLFKDNKLTYRKLNNILGKRYKLEFKND